MQTYARDMRVIAVRRPYAGAAGLQYDVLHPRGIVHAVLRDTPWHPEHLCKLTAFESEGVFSYRRGEWWAYCFDSEEQPAFENPGKALRGAIQVAEQYVRLHGTQEPIDLDKPMTLDLAHELIEAYFPAATRALAAGK